MRKKIFIKIAVLLLIFIGLNYIYNIVLYQKDLEIKAKEIIEIHKQQNITDVFYFGESSNIDVRENDSIKNNISQMLNMFYPDIKFTAINKAATHAGIYKYWVQQIDTSAKKPKAIIVTLNLRSFAAAWRHSKFESQIPEWYVLTRPFPNLVNRLLLSLHGFDNITDQQREFTIIKEWKKTPLIFPYPFKYKTVNEWDRAFAQNDFIKANGNRVVGKNKLASHYVKAYAFNLTHNNQRIKDFDEIVKWSKKNNINLYLNLLAENVEYADSLVGKELVFLMKQNRDYMVNRYNKDNCIVVDNLELVNGIEFTDQNWTTEHYSYKGRMIIAKNLARALSKQFSKEYKNAY